MALEELAREQSVVALGSVLAEFEDHFGRTEPLAMQLFCPPELPTPLVFRRPLYKK